MMSSSAVLRAATNEDSHACFPHRISCQFPSIASTPVEFWDSGVCAFAFWGCGGDEGGNERRIDRRTRPPLRKL